MFSLPVFKKLQPHHYLWHEIRPPLIPRRLVDGKLSLPYGVMMRRRTRDGRWEYQQFPETEEEYDARQW